jgi:3-oxoacyl-[acyl-carrier-protein] synthase III/NAD(P)-dependent dehydrogenase (short-subunit alcohol dehydrogenase family)
MTNYIFSGYGHASGSYEISNADIMDAIRKQYLKGFREDKILKSANYKAFLKEHPNVSPFDYFTGYKMGFFRRWHVAPFPPTRKKLFYAETSLELGVKAISRAIRDAGIQINDVHAWFVSTVSPHEQAPGIAASIKAYFTDFDNDSPVFTLASGCSGFNLNLEHAVEYLQNNPEASHVVVAHTETMSDFLTQRTKFVPFVTFGDAAAAVVLTRKEANEAYGLLSISNHQDMQMVDFVGVDKEGNLYMDDSVIKDRAIVNMSKSGSSMLDAVGWKAEHVNYFVPHQTGNAILLPTAKTIGFDQKQLFLEAQKEYGNVSGATVPISLSMLNSEGRLKPGTKILSSVAGVGGKYGAFAYIVPPQTAQLPSVLHRKDLKGKVCLVTGSTGALGSEICYELARRGAFIILHHANNEEAVNKLKSGIETTGGKATAISADFTSETETNDFIETVKREATDIHYLIHAAGISENPRDNIYPSNEAIMQVNCFAALEISKRLMPVIRETLVYLGSAAEDIPIEGFPGFVASKACLHGAAGSAAGEFISKGIRTIYYMAGILDAGSSKLIPDKDAFRFMIENGQELPISTRETAYRIVSSLYIPKVLNVQNTYEGPMLVRRDGYVLETDV